MEPRHPLAPLTEAEFVAARDVVVECHGSDCSLFFRAVYLEEPKKDDLRPFLVAEHAGTLTAETPRPPRLARVQYDVIKTGQLPVYTQSVVDVAAKKEVGREEAAPNMQTAYTAHEFGAFQEACLASPMFKDAMSEFTIPENFVITIDPWPYGGPDDDENPPRYMQGLVFARDRSLGDGGDNPDANHYAYPVPIIPIMDFMTKQLVRVDRLATGGGGGDDGMTVPPRGDVPKPLFTRTQAAEYVPELLGRPLRDDFKPIDIVQPEGASFRVHADGLIEWQRWRFRVGFTPREGAVLHDVCYQHRPVLYRVSYSEMTVPYGDPRPPFHRKQAFDLGDGGFGRAANNLQLGCDCLGAIHYLDSLTPDADGRPSLAKAVVCLHEQDNGIGWKHTNFRTNRAVVTRLRELVVQCVVTLANYEYVFAYKLDVAGGITLETRATGIMSVVALDEGLTSSPYGNVVAPGVLAQNHQHIFAVRVDPALDSYDDGETQVVVEESHAVPMNPRTNPHGNFYEVRRRVVDRAGWFDAEPRLNRVVRLENRTKKNVVSGKNVGFKIVPPATQLMLADPESRLAKRAKFARHHVWVTGFRDGELWAAGEFTNQSREETGGVADMVARGDWFGEEAPGEAGEGRKSHPVVWSVFGLTHNPRIEDWPVMPCEIHHLYIRPADFFTENPALDVPGRKNEASVLVPCCGDKGSAAGSSAGTGLKTDDGSAEGGSVQRDPLAHMQGAGPDVSAAEAGAGTRQGRRASKVLSSLLSWREKKSS